LTPEHLGRGTTVRIAFEIFTPAGLPPSPPTNIRLWLPAGLSVGNSDLGLANCSLATLERDGPEGCPINSLMGEGSAVAEVPFGARFVTERTRLKLFSAPLQNGLPQLLFAASGEAPVLADIAFPALVLPASARFGGVLDASLPLVPGVPRGPDVALVRLRTTIGPAGIVYHETVKGHRLAFRPRGIVLPRTCPRGGFRFAIAMSFQDGSSAAAETSVACPRRRADQTATGSPRSASTSHWPR
jgi:hypothetical protein